MSSKHEVRASDIYIGNTPVTPGGGTPAGSTGALQFNNAGSFGADSANLFWDDTNNRLGIRTSTPNASLEVVPGTANAGIIIGAVDGYGAAFQLDASSQAGGRGWEVMSTTNSNGDVGGGKFTWRDKSIFPTINGYRLVIDGNGKVGIGIGSPLYQLDVAPATSRSRIAKMQIGAWPYDTNYAFIGHDALDHTLAGNYAIAQGTSGDTYLNSASGQPIKFLINASEKMRLDSNGKFGIGTLSPSDLLTVSNTSFAGGSAALLTLKGGSESSIAFQGTSTTGYTSKLLMNDADGSIWITAGSGTPTITLLNGVVKIHGTTSGFVGLKGAAAAGSTTYTLPAADGTSGQVLSTDGAGILSWTSGGSGSPGGSNTHVQFNNSGSFDGDSGFVYLGNGTARLTGSASNPFNVLSSAGVSEQYYGAVASAGRSFVTTWHDSASPRYVDLHLWGVDNLITLHANNRVGIKTNAPIGSVTIDTTSGSGTGVYITDIASNVGVAFESNGSRFNIQGTNTTLTGALDIALQANGGWVIVDKLKDLSGTQTIDMSSGTNMIFDSNGDINFNTNASPHRMNFGADRIRLFGMSGSTSTIVEFREIGGGNYVALKGPNSIAADVTWTLPGADGTSGQVLSTDGAGNLSWSSASGASAGAVGAIQFSDGSGGFVADATKLYWNNTSKQLAIGIDSAGLYGGGATQESTVTIVGTQPSADPNRGMFSVMNEDTLAAGKYADITLGARFSTNMAQPPTFFAQIRGINETGVDGDLYGNMEFNVRNGTWVTSMKIDRDGNVLPGVGDARNLGSNGLRWQNLYVNNQIIAGNSFINFYPGQEAIVMYAYDLMELVAEKGISIGSLSATTPYDVYISTNDGASMGFGGLNSNVNSGQLTLRTGSTTGTGNSGDVLIMTGTSAATRGKIKLKDGSEGTAGHVWTSTGTDGEGGWSAPAAVAPTVEYRTINAGEATANAIILNAAPADNSKTILDVFGGGGPQEYSVDFVVTGVTLDWSGGPLAGVLVAGDRVRVIYWT